jgi:putative lipoic acid-binding regulatory protein
MVDIAKTDTEAPRIEFPCQYPVKVMGAAGADFRANVLAVFRRHAAEVDESRVVARESREGNYLALTVTIEATGEGQLQALFTDLKTVSGVKLVL